MKKQILLFLTLALCMSMCCVPDYTTKYLTEDDKSWLPYEVGDSLLFYRNDTLIETLVVQEVRKDKNGVNKYLEGCNVNDTETKQVRLSLYKNVDYFFQGLMIGYRNDTLNLQACSNSVCNYNAWNKIDKSKKINIKVQGIYYEDVCTVYRYHPRIPRLYYIKENVGLIRYVESDSIIYDVVKK